MSNVRALLQKDSWAIDYQATKNVLDVAREKGAKHFVLLSAICVQKPLLEFQHAKLKLEAALQTADDITYSIVADSLLQIPRGAGERFTFFFIASASRSALQCRQVSSGPGATGVNIGPASEMSTQCDHSSSAIWVSGIELRGLPMPLGESFLTWKHITDTSD